MFEGFLRITVLKIPDSLLAMLGRGRRTRRLLRNRGRDDARKPEERSEKNPQPAAMKDGDRFLSC
jgi:hypothetical protein